MFSTTIIIINLAFAIILVAAAAGCLIKTAFDKLVDVIFK
jgi:hypothetical protein